VSIRFSLPFRQRSLFAWRAFPLVYGVGRAVLLGAVSRFGCSRGWLGFRHGHEGATTMAASATGDAANMEMAFLLGA
jgi:hypothetical protein